MLAICFNSDRQSFLASTPSDFPFGIGIEDGFPPSCGTNSVLPDEPKKHGQSDDYSWQQCLPSPNTRRP
jgi:hypothetical protein